MLIVVMPSVAIAIVMLKVTKSRYAEFHPFHSYAEYCDAECHTFYFMENVPFQSFIMLSVTLFFVMPIGTMLSVIMLDVAAPLKQFRNKFFCKIC